MRTASYRSSAAVHRLMTDVLRGVAVVTFANGYRYMYKNVSRRAIANLQLNPNMSLGFWVNKNCVGNDRTTCEALGYNK